MRRSAVYLLYLGIFILINIFNDLVFKFSLFPDILFILLVYIALSSGRNYGQVFGFIIGLVSDSFGSNAFGAAAFIYTVIGFFTGFFRIYIEKSNIFSGFLLVVVLNVIYLLGTKGLNGIFSVEGISYFCFRNILRIIINGLAFLLLFRFLDSLEEKFIPRK